MDTAIAVIAALVLGTLVDYAGHRALHGCLRRTCFGRRHAQHHRKGDVDSWPAELAFYQLVVLPFGLAGLLAAAAPGAWGVGAGWVVGCSLFGLWMAWVHKVEHDSRPDGRHAVHHRRPTANYGTVTGFWDVVLGTEQH